MAGIMQHAGYLDDDEKVSQPAIKAFLDHRNAIIKGDVDPYFQKETSEPLRGQIITLNDKERYPGFFEKWTNKLEIALKMLNMQSNVQVPFFDTMALGGALNLDSPDMSFSSLMGILMASTTSGPPTSFQIPLLTLNVEPVKIPEIVGKIKSEVIKLPEIPNPVNFFPAIPSPRFPVLAYPVPVFNLKDKQISIFTQIPTILVSVMTEFLKIENLSKFATEGPLALIELSYKAIQAGLPKPPGLYNVSYDANIEALSRTIAKPIGITTVGITIGSAKNGITGNIGASEPDPMKIVEQPPEQCSETLINAWFNPIQNFYMRSTPQFRRAIVETAKRLEIKDPDWLVVCMGMETAGSWSAQARGGKVKRIVPFSKAFAEKYTEPELKRLMGRMPRLSNFESIISAAGITQAQRIEYVKFARETLDDYKWLKYGEARIEMIGDKTILSRVEVHFDNHPKLPKGMNENDPKAPPPYYHRGITTYIKIDESQPNPILKEITPTSPITLPNQEIIDTEDVRMLHSSSPDGSISEPTTKEEENMTLQVTDKYYAGDSGPAIGLIQFTQNAIDDLNQNSKFAGKTFSVQAPTEKSPRTLPRLMKEVLANMTEVEQLEVVEEYLKRTFKLGNVQISSGSEIKNIESFYALIFTPGFFNMLNRDQIISDILSQNEETCSLNHGFVPEQFKVKDKNGKYLPHPKYKTGILLSPGFFLSRKLFLGKLYKIINDSKIHGGRVCVDEQRLILPRKDDKLVV